MTNEGIIGVLALGNPAQREVVPDALQKLPSALSARHQQVMMEGCRDGP